MKFLCLGSLNLDFTYQVNDFVRAGETIAALERNEFCGGKGLHQSIALARAGAQVWHGGRIGADGVALQNRLEESGVRTELLETIDGPTGHAIIQVSPKGQNCIIIYGGANQRITNEDVDEMLSHFEAGDVLLLQNETSGRDYAMEQAAKKGMLVALNPSPIDAGLLASPALSCVRWFILNEIEGEEITGEKEPETICKALRAKYPGCEVVLTLGSAGVICYDGAEFYRHGCFRVDAVDTTAAGDTFTGYFLASVAQGLTIPEALKRASTASAIAVSRPGASDSIPLSDEVAATILTLR